MRIRIPATGMVPITRTGRRRTTGMVRRTTAIAIRRTTATETGTTSVTTPDVTSERLPGTDQGAAGYACYARVSLRDSRATFAGCNECIANEGRLAALDHERCFGPAWLARRQTLKRLQAISNDMEGLFVDSIDRHLRCAE